MYIEYIMNNTPTTLQSESKMNAEIYMRNIPSSTLQPYINVRPVSTKYSILPIVDPRARINVPLQVQQIYNTQTIFNPGNTTSPWSGYASKVNVESELKNQVFALQKCEQREYVPSSNSDLYVNNVPATPNIQNHPLLFVKNKFDQCNPTPSYATMKLFNNSTREEMRNSGQ